MLLKCLRLESLNLSSCRALPRGMKRLYTGKELQDLKDNLDPAKTKAKEEKKSDDKKSGANETVKSDQSKLSASSDNNTTTKSDFADKVNITQSPDSKSTDGNIPMTNITKPATPILQSPGVPSKPDSSSTPRSETSHKLDMGSPHFSPVAKPDSQVQNSPEIQEVTKGSNSWNLGQFKTTPTHRSEASPLSRLDTHSKIKQCKVIEQCSPTTSQEKLSPENMQSKQDYKNSTNWNYGNYSPMPRQDAQFSQRSPYSAQPSPAQPSPYSTQPSPYSTQPSPYSSQPSPYSAQPSPDTSQMVKSDLQKSSSQWNTGNYSPMTKHPAPFSPLPATIHTSPDPGIGIKGESMRSNPNKTPGQYSPMSRQDRIHQSPYSPRPSVDSIKKSPGMGNYSPMMRSDCLLPSPDGGQARVMSARPNDMYQRSTTKVPDVLPSSAEITAAWGMDRYGLGVSTAPLVDPSFAWGGQGFTEPIQGRADSIPGVLNTPPAQNWHPLPSFEGAMRRDEELPDPWSQGQFRMEAPHRSNSLTNFEQNVIFDAMSGRIPHLPQNFLDEGFSRTSRIE